MQDLTQHDVDHLMQQRLPEQIVVETTGMDAILIEELPKGFNRATLDKVLAYIKKWRGSISGGGISLYRYSTCYS